MRVLDLSTAEVGEAVAVTSIATGETGPPELREGLDPLDVSPGLLGFAVIFAVVLACIPLFRSMTGKLRNVDQRARLEEDGHPDEPQPPQQPGT